MNKRIYLFATILILFIGSLFWSKHFSNISKEVDKSVYGLFTGDKNLLSSPIDSPFGLSAPSTLELPFSQPIITNGFSLFFPGNQHAVSSYLASDFDVYYQNANKEWKLAEQIRDNKSPLYNLSLTENQKIIGFKLVIHRAAQGTGVQVNDLKLFYQQKISYLEGLIFYLKDSNKSFPAYLFYALLFYFLILIPGQVLLSKTKFTSELKLVFAPILSIVVLFILSLLFIFTHLDLFTYFYILFFLISLFFYFKLKLYQELTQTKFPLFILISVLLIVSLLQAQRDFLFNLNYIEKYLDNLEFIPEQFHGGYFGYHGDNFLQWGIARSFLHHVPIFSQTADKYRIGFDGTSVFDRTPFLSIIVVPILKIFGESHFIYQKLLNVLMALSYPAIYLVIKTFFSKKTALIVSVLTLLSVHLTYQTFNVEIYFKYFSMYPVFLALLLYKLRGHLDLSIGLLLGLAFFIHPMTLIFTAIIFIFHLINSKFKFSKKFFWQIFITILPVATLFCFWLILSWYAQKDISLLDKSAKQNIYIARIFSISNEGLINKIFNIINLFVPDFLTKALSPGISYSKYLMVTFLRYSLISALTPIIFMCGIFLFNKKFTKKYCISLCFGFGSLASVPILVNNYTFVNYVLLYLFCLPFLLGFIIERLFAINSLIRSLIIISFPVFNFATLFYWSGIFTTIKHTQTSIDIIFWSLISIYILLSAFLLKLSLQPNK